YRDYARDIVASARHLLDMINDILDLSRIEAGRYVIAPESVAARDAVGAAFRLVRTKAAAKRIDLVAELGEEAAVLWVDPRSIRQILLNLLSNAMKFSNAGGRITVTARRVAGHGVEIAVADTGFGMTPEEIPIALEPFGQVSSAHARSHEGTGLGLPIVKSLIDLHHGRLAIESEKGRGTTVRAVFPDPSSKKEDRAV
ncbi:MAG: HAMP domain-containing histidine kinase, partial [Alphaproteobacteria bacterium]|nr:HAMP domain-containing histidine kinase [Alphaproteobacteria bacterium]